VKPLFEEKAMAWRRILFLVVIFSTLGVSTARAQHEFEITPFGGSRFGGVIDLANTTAFNGGDVDYLTIKSSVSYGIMGDYTLFQSVPSFQLEFMYNHQPTEIGQHVVATDTKTDLTSADVDMYQWGFNYTFRDPEKKIRPYVVGGLGFTHFNAGGDLPFSNRFSYNLGIGAKYFFSRHVGLRVEGRWSPTRTTVSPEEIETFFGPELIGVTNHAEQGQANVGLIFRFK
jgi:opacity protein-like surface antigen